MNLEYHFHLTWLASGCVPFFFCFTPRRVNWQEKKYLYRIVLMNERMIHNRGRYPGELVWGPSAPEDIWTTTSFSLRLKINHTWAIIVVRVAAESEMGAEVFAFIFKDPADKTRLNAASPSTSPSRSVEDRSMRHHVSGRLPPPSACVAHVVVQSNFLLPQSWSLVWDGPDYSCFFSYLNLFYLDRGGLCSADTRGYRLSLIYV